MLPVAEKALTNLTAPSKSSWVWLLCQSVM